MPLRQIRRGAGLALVLALAPVLVAQTPAGQPVQRPATQPPVQAGQAQPTRPDFKMAIDLVNTDVIVRNNTDQFIANLNQEDFEVFEDGVKQDVSSFTLVHGGRVHNLLAPARAAAQEGIILPSSRPRNDAAGRIFLIVVDDLHLAFRDTGRIRDLFKEISSTLIHEGDMFSVVSTGTSSLAIDPTYDRKILEDVIARIAGGGLTPSEIIQGANTAEGPAEVRHRAHVAFTTARDMLLQLERIVNRRKVVIWISNGFDFNPFAESRLGEDPVFGGRFGQTREQGRQDRDRFNHGHQFADADLARELADLTRTGKPGKRDHQHHRSARPGCRARPGPAARPGGIRRARTQDAGQPARAGRRNRRHPCGQPERFQQGAAEDRQRDERLLHAWLLLDESGSIEAYAQDRGQGQEARSQRVVADVGTR